MSAVKRIAVIFMVVCINLLGVSSSDVQVENSGADFIKNFRLPKKNYVRNGSFEHGMEGWSYFVHKAGGFDNKVVFRGKTSFRMGGFDENRYIFFQQTNISLEAGKTYTLSAMVKIKDIPENQSSYFGHLKASRTYGVLFLVNAGWTKDVRLKPPPKNMEWTRISETFVAPETRLGPDGKQVYTLVVLWPPKSQGQFWLDDIQIEKGDKATEYSDVYIGDGLNALGKLKLLGQQIFVTFDALRNFRKTPLSQSLSIELNEILSQAVALREDLKQLDRLSKSDREGLTRRVAAVAVRLAKIRTVVWTGPAHIPLREVELPGVRPENVGIELTCLKGEHRDIALNIANLTTSGYSGRLVVSELYNRDLALRISPLQWVTVYTVPRMRGYQKPTKVFTDALPEIDNAGIIQIQPSAINQAIISINTLQLLPGDYTGSIIITSLLDAANRQEIPVKLKVLPRALLPIENVDIVECFGIVDYAWDAMVKLGVNTFDLSTSWIDVDFDKDGSLSRIDFTRADRKIRDSLKRVPDARFFFLGMSSMFGVLERRYKWKSEEPKFERAIKEWIKAIVDHMRILKVEPSRLIIETYDEPGPGDYVRGIKMARWIRETEPAIQSQYYVTGINRDQAWKDMALAHDIIGPGVSVCNADNMKYLKTLGKKIWVYDCQADGETLHPIAYYRLMPWMCRKYGIRGWGQFSWFNTSHGRAYRAWEGVEAQNVVYPALDGKNMVISRRFLGMRAGNEDYQILDALDRAISMFSSVKLQQAEVAGKFFSTVYDRALSLSPRKRHYQTHLKVGIPVDLLDKIRQEAVAKLAALLPPSERLKTVLVSKDKKTMLSVNLPGPGKIRIQYLVEGKLPWYIREKEVPAGKVDIVWDDLGEINRCLVEFTDKKGKVLVGSPLIIPLIQVDSTIVPYTQRPLNDGIRMEAVKFETGFAWISSAKVVEHWVEMDLGESRRVSVVNLYWMTFTGLPQKTMLQYFDQTGWDTGKWKPVSATPNWRPAEGPVERIRFTPVTTSKLRILMAPGGGGYGGPSLMGLSEVEVLSLP